MPPNPKTLLEQFVVNNADLERLESLLNQFNIFEATGMVRQEIRHSHFLAFLLNPSASHHLRDIFLKTFLKRLLLEADNATVSPIEIDVATLTDTQVCREWKNIDILLVSPGSQIVCAIENKVDSSEHSNQLQRYRQIVQQEFPNYRQIFVFLTPQGIVPYGEVDQAHWSAYSYRKVADLIGEVCDRHRSTLQPEVCTLMQHYSTLINRHLMQDSEIAKLCRDIYLQHKEALDLIYEHRPNLESNTFEIVKNMVKSTPPNIVISDHIWAAINIVGFVVPDWDKLSFQKTCQGWTTSNRLVIFEFKQVEPPILRLHLILGPGDLETRQAIAEVFAKSDLIGRTGHKPVQGQRFNCLVERIIENISAEESMMDISETLHRFWQSFLKEELPKINDLLFQNFAEVEE